MPPGSFDIGNMDGYLTSTACRFLEQRGARTPVRESAIDEICENDGIELSSTQAEYLRAFGGLCYQPLGASPDFHSCCFLEWTMPDESYERGIISHEGKFLVGRCYETGEFDPQGLWMAPDGSLSDDSWNNRLIVSESVAKEIEVDATVWAGSHPFAGVAWIREDVPVHEVALRIQGDVVDAASDDWNCVFVSGDFVGVWSCWAPAFDRKYGNGQVLGTRLDVYSSSILCFNQIVKRMDEAKILNSSCAANEC